MKKIISFILAAVMLITLAACGETYALKYGETTMSENEYLYWLSRYKGTFVYSMLGGEDKIDKWETPIPTSDKNATVEDFLYALAFENLKNNLVSLELFDVYGLKLDKNSETAADEYVKSLEEKAQSAGSNLTDELSALSINKSTLKKLYIDEQKSAALKAHLFAEGGELEVTNAERDARYNDTYVRIKHIYINTVEELAKTDEGDLIIDQSTGTYKTRKLTEEEVAERTARAKMINAELLTGADFDKLMLENTADTYMNVYTDGYYCTADSTYLPSALIERAFDMPVGECAYIESDIGIHIIKREALIEGAYANEKNAAFFTDFETLIQNGKLASFYEKYTPDVEVNNEIISNYRLATVPMNISY